MAHADYQTALKNGIDAARSGSRMMARLHLLKAADLAPDDVAAHLWLAWVAETPSDALVHLDEALARQPKHALTRLGRLWTQLMAEYDAAKDYSQCDLSSLSSGPGTAKAVSPPAVEDVSRTQRLSGLTVIERREKKTQPGKDAQESASHAPSSVSQPNPPRPSEPLDLTRTVRMDLFQRERPEESNEPSPALTCLMPQKPAATQPGAHPTTPVTPPAAVDPTSSPTSPDEVVSTGTIRIDPNAVKRALAESVIAEMTSSDHNGGSANAAEMEESEPDADSPTPEPVEQAVVAEAIAAPPPTASRVNAYTEAPAPALGPDDHEDSAPRGDEPNPTGPRVLVVDDSPTVRKLVSATLEAQGYRVACASSGYEAVEILAHATPEALVIEVDLPRLDGLHLCKLLRSQEATRHVPVIFLTRRSGTMDRMRGKMVGATAYLTKPFRSLALIDEMAACCPVGRS